MEFAPQVSTIAQAIQLSVAPVFLLAGIGAILNLLATRLARVIDRGRVLEARIPGSSDDARGRDIRELRLLDWRIKIINFAIFLIVSSAVAVSLVVVLLFVAELVHLRIGTMVAIAFIAAMILLMIGLVLFLVETQVASRIIRINADLLTNNDSKAGVRIK